MNQFSFYNQCISISKIRTMSSIAERVKYSNRSVTCQKECTQCFRNLRERFPGFNLNIYESSVSKSEDLKKLVKPSINLKVINEKIKKFERKRAYSKGSFKCKGCAFVGINIVQLTKHYENIFLSAPYEIKKKSFPFKCNGCDFTGNDFVELAQHYESILMSSPLKMKQKCFPYTASTLFELNEFKSDVDTNVILKTINEYEYEGEYNQNDFMCKGCAFIGRNSIELAKHYEKVFSASPLKMKRKCFPAIANKQYFFECKKCDFIGANIGELIQHYKYFYYAGLVEFIKSAYYEPRIIVEKSLNKKEESEKKMKEQIAHAKRVMLERWDKRKKLSNNECGLIQSAPKEYLSFILDASLLPQPEACDDEIKIEFINSFELVNGICDQFNDNVPNETIEYKYEEMQLLQPIEFECFDCGHQCKNEMEMDKHIQCHTINSKIDLSIVKIECISDDEAVILKRKKPMKFDEINGKRSKI